MISKTGVQFHFYFGGYYNVFVFVYFFVYVAIRLGDDHLILREIHFLVYQVRNIYFHSQKKKKKKKKTKGGGGGFGMLIGSEGRQDRIFQMTFFIFLQTTAYSVYVNGEAVWLILI